MPIPIISRVSWIAKTIGTGAMASAIGVTSRAVNYWMTGERIPMPVHLQSLERLYERSQYASMRFRGIAPIPASKYRGLYPETFDLWTSRLDDTLDKYTSGHVGARMAREGKTVADYTRAELQTMWDEEYERLLADVDESGDDIEELIESP